MKSNFFSVLLLLICFNSFGQSKVELGQASEMPESVKKLNSRHLGDLHFVRGMNSGQRIPALKMLGKDSDHIYAVMRRGDKGRSGFSLPQKEFFIYDRSMQIQSQIDISEPTGVEVPVFMDAVEMEDQILFFYCEGSKNKSGVHPIYVRRFIKGEDHIGEPTKLLEFEADGGVSNFEIQVSPDQSLFGLAINPFNGYAQKTYNSQLFVFDQALTNKI